MNVVVDFQNDKLRTQNNVTNNENIMLGAENVPLNGYSAKQTTLRHEGSDGEGDIPSAQGVHEVLGGSQKMD